MMMAVVVPMVVMIVPMSMIMVLVVMIMGVVGALSAGRIHAIIVQQRVTRAAASLQSGYEPHEPLLQPSVPGQ